MHLNFDIKISPLELLKMITIEFLEKQLFNFSLELYTLIVTHGFKILCKYKIYTQKITNFDLIK